MFENGARRFSRRVDVIRNGAAVTQLEIVDAPTVNMDAAAALKMSMSGTFRKNAIFDALTDYIKPIIILDDVEYPLGEYVISTAANLHEPARDTVRIEAYDKTLILQQSKIETRYHIAATTKYTDAIQALLLADGVSRVICDPSDAVFATAREDWEIGTDHLTIINALLKEINYSDVWFDLTGVARLHRYITPSVSNIKHTYESGELSIIKAETESELDIYDAPNVFIAIVSNADYAAAMTATAINDSPASALSTIRRGRRIPNIERLDNIASQDELQAYADNKRTRSMLATETIKFSTASNPVHEVGDVLALKHPALNGIYEETAWSITLEAGADMTHEARRAMYL
jgi:hypothetical protein